MKKLLTINGNLKLCGYAFLFSLMLEGCTNGDLVSYKSEGTVIGPDLKMCVCCGGWEITIDNKTYHFEMPSNSGISADKDKFPLRVKLNWEIENTACKWIIVSDIKKI